MATYHILCANKEGVRHPSWHEHIASVGLWSGDNSTPAVWSVAQVVSALNAGDTFYTQSPSTNKRATVHAYECRQCRARIIRSAPDAIHDNNLDNLPNCA